MNAKKLELEHALLLLKDELKQLSQQAQLDGNQMARLREIIAERERLEDDLINIVVTTDNYHTEAREGLREGLLAGVQALEENLRGAELPDDLPRPEEKTKKVSRITQFFTRIANRPILPWLYTGGFIYLLLIAVAALGSGFNSLFGGREAAEQLFAFATNPFMGLMMGLLATAIIQSSSVTTSVIVALCVGGLPIEAAIPMVMGANIGTSVTNTLVSLGHIGHRREFRRAFAAATIHDFFNITAVCIFLPCEMAFGLLKKVSALLSGWLYGGTTGFNLDAFNVLAMITKPVEKALHTLFRLIPGEKLAEGLYILFGFALVFVAILLLGTLLRLLFTGRAEKVFRSTVNRGGLSAIFSGFVITTLVQSSSTTTSLVVPLAGGGLMRLKQVFPFTLGANIGTCVTALLAALAITGAGAELGLQIAFVHFLFNALGVLLIYGIPFLRKIPLIAAASLAKLASTRRPLAILYILFAFFILPLIGLGIYRLFE